MKNTKIESISEEFWPIIDYNYEQIRFAEIKASVIISFYSLLLTVSYTLDILDEVVNEPKETLITLNGLLRIIPPDKCAKYNIYNGHPGLITKYPELKGKDPQEKAWKDIHNYDTVGSVVHKVVEEVDAGEIATVSEVSSDSILTLDEMYHALRSTSFTAWGSFLKERLYNKV